MKIYNLKGLFLITLLTSLFCTMGMNAANAISEPDFAFPKKVSAQAEINLATALKKSDGQAVVRALIDLTLAQSAITVDSLPSTLERIKQVQAEEKYERTKALLNILTAQIYQSIYSANKYKFDTRLQPLTPLPTDYTEWSGEQFRHVISSLCTEALRNARELQSASLADYTDIITADRETLIYYPTLYDFVANESIKLRRTLSQFSNIFSLLMLSPRNIFIISPAFVPASPEAQQILDIYANLLRVHKDDIAPLIRIELDRINFITQGVYYNLSEKAQKQRLKLLNDLYATYSGSQFSGDILIELSSAAFVQEEDDDPLLSNTILTPKRLYSELKSFEKRYPDFYRINCIKNTIASLAQKSVNISSPQIVAPAVDFKIKINASNTTAVTVKIYRLPESFDNSDNYYRFNPATPPALVSTHRIPFTGQIPFSTDTNITVSVPSYGCYIAVPEIDGKKNNSRQSYRSIRCTQLAVGRMALDKTTIITINPATGQPIENATLMFIDNSRTAKSKLIKLGTTDKNGFHIFNKGHSGQVYAIKGSDRYSMGQYMYDAAEDGPEWELFTTGYSDLAIYHPGDTVQWSIIAYQSKGTAHRLCNDKKIKVYMRNANGITVDTCITTTDSYGRTHGTFVIPQGELTGSYQISTEIDDEFFQPIEFMVSDYKLPTFFVEVTQVDNGSPTEGDITLRGTVRTYSGIPMSGIPITLDLSVAERYWWRVSNSVPFYNVTDSTDSYGNFNIVLTKQLIENSPAPTGLFTAEITATSLSGESRQTSKRFSPGQSMQLLASLPSDINVSIPHKINVKVLNGAGNPITHSVNYRIISDDDIIYQSSLNTDDPTINWSTIPSGTYRVVFTLPDSPSDSVSIDYISLYRPDDTMPPIASPLWVPQEYNDIIIEKGNSTTLLYGTSFGNTYMLYTLSDDKRIIEQRWIKSPAGLHKLDIKLPDDCDAANISLYVAHNYKNHNLKLKVTKRNSIKSLKIIAESFRDRLIPGTEETWTFRTVGTDSNSVESAMILSMYNSALDALETQFRQFNPSNTYLPSFSIDAPSIQGSVYANVSTSYSRLRCNSIIVPQFNTYGRNFYSNFIRIRGTNMLLMGKAAGIMAKDEAKVAESTEEEAADELLNVVEHSQVFDSSASLAEVVVTCYGVNTSDGGESGMAQNSKEDTKFSYRKSEVPLAFFRPMLTTDASGHLSFSFRVPDANTTWRFNALAYTKEIITDNFTADIVANKPVMVQPNLPRFLRTGDSAIINALVINNSESETDIAVCIELFDPSTSAVTASSDTTISIPAGSSSTTAITVHAPENAPFIGYRIKAHTDKFADGEQALIPVLPSITPVIETQPFYISPDSLLFTMQLPKLSRDARVTLQFCDNPTWYVVTALPGLQSGKPSSAQEAADAIFSAAVAEGILRSDPVIAHAIREWTESNRSDSTLVSMLERNADLKTILLQATPWMMDARSDTERMQRLALLFDKNQIKQVYSQSIATLTKLQRGDGGWAWIDQCTESSQWCTGAVLYTLGRLNRLGYFPDNKTLYNMMLNAMAYYQTEVEKQYRRYPKNDYTYFVTLCDLWKDFTPSLTGNNIINLMVQRTIKGWRDMSIGGKARAAIMLHNHGYDNTALTILESLRQYAESTPTQGMWWPSVGDLMGGSMTQLSVTADALMAFHTLMPNAKEVDAIRQWLILQKETRNWGTSSTASDVIAAILSTSQTWVAKAQPAQITIAGTPVTPEKIEDILGYFRTDISRISHSGDKMVVRKSDMTPAWGAIYSQSRNSMTDVKAAKCEAVSIEKRFYKQVGNQWQETSDLKVGDRVKVQLIIHANRDMEYVAITDDRAACLEPVEQLPAPIYSDGICFYRENRDACTTMFVTRMPKGTYMLGYELWVNNSGTYASGIATLQSQYAPQITAHSSGTALHTNP